MVFLTVLTLPSASLICAVTLAFSLPAAFIVPSFDTVTAFALEVLYVTTAGCFA